MTIATNFIDLAPKDVADNLRWRLAWREAALADKKLQNAFFDAAMDDPLFFFNAFAWCYEPRAPLTTVPMVTWPHQDPAILAMDQAIDDSRRRRVPLDVLLDKSRDQGATWMYLYIVIRRFLRDNRFSAGLVTRNEKLVDSRTNEDALLWKVDWSLSMLPRWMLPKGYIRNFTDHSVFNPASRSTITGFSSAADAGRGGRKSVFCIDELGALDFISGGKDQLVLDSTGPVSNCRIIASTYGADHGAWYDAVTDTESDARKVILDWMDNPSQNELLYTLDEDFKATAKRPEEQFRVERYVKRNMQRILRIQRKGHKIFRTPRSPWFDAVCLRSGATPRSIAREYGRNPRGVVGKVFDIEVLDKMAAECCRHPVWQGRPIIDPQMCIVTGLIEQDGGPLKLWFKPGLNLAPPAGTYGIGADISAGGIGEFASNSVATGGNLMTGEQVMEYTVKGMQAIKFARVNVALARWLRNALLGWEATGPTGSTFQHEVLEEQDYHHVYMRVVSEYGTTQVTRKPGWWNGSDEDKGLLFERFNMALEEGRFIPRSDQMIRECGEYEWGEKGEIIHAPTKHARGRAGKAHGDRAIAAGVLNLLILENESVLLDKSQEEADNPPYGCWAWRQMQEDVENERWTDDKPQPGLRDVIRDY